MSARVADFRLHSTGLAALVATMLLAGCQGRGGEAVASGHAPPGPLPTAVPVWHAVGADVFTPGRRLKMQAGTLPLIAGPRWFVGAGPAPVSLAAIPTTGRDGATVSLNGLGADDETLVFDLTVVAGTEPVYRETETRRTNTWPLLLAVFVDGEPGRPAGTSEDGVAGQVSREVFVPAGESRTFQIKLREDSVLALIPADRKPHEVILIVAFSSARHAADSSVRRGAASPAGAEVIRSGPVRLLWTGKRWKFLG